MAKYIPLDALVAEINRLIAELVEKGEDTMFEQGRISAFEDAKLFLDNLEAKEVDLDREMQAFAALYLEPLKISDSNIGISITMEQLYSCARNFFQLGLNASNPLPLTWEDVRLLDLLCCKVDMSCDLEEKEHYEEVLKRFKERKEK